jgi:hypothetical protein
MKFLDAIKQKGNPFIIPDCGRDNLPGFFVEMGYKVGVEIGVLRGKFSKKLSQAGLKLYAIDPWIGFHGQGRTQNEQIVQDGYYEQTKKILTPYKNCTIIRKTSMEALVNFKDKSLDFVFIDGDHDFRHAAEDIFEWSKKVRAGGAVAGHDYFDTAPFARNMVCNVKSVLDAYVKAFDITDWYLYRPDGATDADDKCYSWMFIRK